MREPLPAPLYVLRGPVVSGRGKGRLVGMPTANILPPKGASLPKAGVYAAVLTHEGRAHLGVTNVGTRPSVDEDSAVSVETYLLDFSGDLYGEVVTLALYQHLRETRKMPSLLAVKQQVEKDAERVKHLLLD